MKNQKFKMSGQFTSVAPALPNFLIRIQSLLLGSQKDWGLCRFLNQDSKLVRLLGDILVFNIQAKSSPTSESDTERIIQIGGLIKMLQI